MRGAHAVVLLDQAGWHMSAKLEVPDNLTLLPLPPPFAGTQSAGKCVAIPGDNSLLHRIFNSYDDIVAHCCQAWNKLIEQPWRIMSIRMGSDE